MATKQFIYVPANPIRLIPIAATDPLYNSLQFDLWDSDDCYKQPWQANENTTLQVLSDYGVPEFNIYNAETTRLAKNCPAVAQVINIVGQTYTCYEIIVDWTGVDNGRYYCELTYTNDIAQVVLFRSGLQELKTKQPNTILLEYRNSENVFNVIFDTGIVFKKRVPAEIADYTPEFEDDTYNDQKHNSTLLYSVYYDQFKAYFPGYGGFIPAYEAKRINIALSCDSVKWDNVYYQRLEGSKWDVARVAERKDIMGINIDIVPVDNLFVNRIKTNTDNTNTANFQIVSKSLQYKNQSANFSIPSVFKRYTNLRYIAVNNNSLSDFDMAIGTTPGGQELGVFGSYDIDVTDGHHIPVDDLIFTLEALFNGSETVYITGLTGVVGLSIDVSPVFDQIDAPAIALPFTVPDQLGKGFTARYKELSPGDIISAFDLGTGLGIAGSKWEKWAIADGRNGGVDESQCVAVMYDPTNPDYDTLDGKGGANSITLNTAQLPEFFLYMFVDEAKSFRQKPTSADTVAVTLNVGGDLQYEMAKGDSPAVIGRTSTIGSGAAIDARMKYIVALNIIKIQD